MYKAFTMPSVFSRIIQGEIPSYKVAESEKFYAFLDIFPLVRGHSLVVPKKEVDYLFELEDSLLGEMMVFSKKVGLAIEKVIPCERIGLTVMGIDVPHAHIHLIPFTEINDMNFSREKLSLSKEEFEDIAMRIREAFEQAE